MSRLYRAWARTWARTWDSDLAYAFRHSPIAIIATLVVTLLILGAVFAPLVAPHDRNYSPPLARFVDL